MMIHQVIILRGLPGAGKTTVASTLALASRGIICSADQFMLNSEGEYHFDPERLQYCHDSCFQKFCKELASAVQNKKKYYIDKSYTIIVDNTNTQYWEFQKYIDKVDSVNHLLQGLGSADKFIVTQLIVENPTGRQSIHDVPEATITKMAERFEIKLGYFDQELLDQESEVIQLKENENEHHSSIDVEPYDSTYCSVCKTYVHPDVTCDLCDTSALSDAVDPDYDE